MVAAFCLDERNVFSADILCSEHSNVCEVVDGEDIGVGWGVIESWEVPVWRQYILNMPSIQSNYDQCR